jgi:hypothetical protein
MKGRSKFLLLLLVVFAVLLALPRPASADVVNTTVVGASPFVYGGYAYVPLKSVTDFLGAALLWDSLKGRAVITYGGKELGLVIGSPSAYYLGRPVELPAAPVIVGGRVLVPASALNTYLGVPIVWDRHDFKVKIKGRKGWGVFVVERRPSWHGGPPPWAPAWGVRDIPPGHAKKAGVVFEPGEGQQKRSYLRTRERQWKPKGLAQKSRKWEKRGKGDD